MKEDLIRELKDKGIKTSFIKADKRNSISPTNKIDKYHTSLLTPEDCINIALGEAVKNGFKNVFMALSPRSHSDVLSITFLLKDGTRHLTLFFRLLPDVLINFNQNSQSIVIHQQYLFSGAIDVISYPYFKKVWYSRNRRQSEQDYFEHIFNLTPLLT